MALEDGLVEFWTLNDTLTGAVAGSTLVASDGGTHYEAAKIGNGWDFAATNTRALYANPSPWDPDTGDWSASTWLLYPDADLGTGARRVWALRDGTTGRATLYLYTFAYDSDLDETTAVFRFQAGATIKDLTFVTSGSGYSTWHLITVKYDGTTDVISYSLDGSAFSDASGTVAITASASPNLTIGASRPSSEGANTPWATILDAMGFWSRKLSDSEAAELYNSGAGWEYSPPTPPAEPKVTAMLLLMIEESNGRTTEKRIPLGVA